jgi:hypothetical protein
MSNYKNTSSCDFHLICNFREKAKNGKLRRRVFASLVTSLESRSLGRFPRDHDGCERLEVLVSFSIKPHI